MCTDEMARLTVLAAHLLLALCGPGKGGAGDSITTYSLVFLQACVCANTCGIYKRACHHVYRSFCNTMYNEIS